MKPLLITFIVGISFSLSAQTYNYEIVSTGGTNEETGENETVIYENGEYVTVSDEQLAMREEAAQGTAAVNDIVTSASEAYLNQRKNGGATTLADAAAAAANATNAAASIEAAAQSAVSDVISDTTKDGEEYTEETFEEEFKKWEGIDEADEIPENEFPEETTAKTESSTLDQSVSSQSLPDAYVPTAEEMYDPNEMNDFVASKINPYDLARIPGEPNYTDGNSTITGAVIDVNDSAWDATAQYDDAFVLPEASQGEDQIPIERIDIVNLPASRGGASYYQQVLSWPITVRINSVTTQNGEQMHTYIGAGNANYVTFSPALGNRWPDANFTFEPDYKKPKINGLIWVVLPKHDGSNRYWAQTFEWTSAVHTFFFLSNIVIDTKVMSGPLSQANYAPRAGDTIGFFFTAACARLPNLMRNPAAHNVFERTNVVKATWPTFKSLVDESVQGDDSIGVDVDAMQREYNSDLGDVNAVFPDNSGNGG